ncbi:MAG: hypothetical protein KIT09_21120 [Bryobacteraceae bacterium]|nr:hypothetical protein [Bryobacteraceae bacterium]
MAGRQGAVVALDGRSGRTLLCHDERRAATRTARPGSTVKPFTLAALLEANVVTPKTTLVCESPLRVAGRRLPCAHPRDSVPLDPVTALAFSCNFFFATMARLLQPSRLVRAFERAGLGAAPGIVRLAQSGDQLQLQALGESGIETTPLALAAAYRQLSRWSEEAPSIREGLLGAVEYGTGQLARRGKRRIAGKTGTATSRNGAWTHGWFAGFSPPASPEIVVVVFLERGQGGLDAAPIAGAVFEAFT